MERDTQMRISVHLIAGHIDLLQIKIYRLLIVTMNFNCVFTYLNLTINKREIYE